MNAYRFTTTITENRTVVRPREVPRGEAEILVLVQDIPVPAAARMPFRGMPYRFEDPFTPAVPTEDWDAYR